MTKSSSFSIFFYFSIFSVVFFPTSINNHIIAGFVPLAILISCSFFILYAVITSSIIYFNVLIFSLFFFLLFIFTMFSPFSVLTLGAIFPYLAMAVVLSVSLKKLDYDLGYAFFLAISFIFIFIGYGIIINYEPIIRFVFYIYSAYYPELLTHMITWHSKPVTVFGTHSLAAFVYFFFALIFFKLAYARFRPILHFLCSLLFLFLLFSLKSFSSYALLVIYFYSCFCIINYKFKFYFSVAFFVLTLLVLVLGDFSHFYDNLVLTLSSSGNGLLGRYSGVGTRLAGSFDFLFRKFFLIGIGMTSDPSLSFGDCFLTDYVIRTSIFGYFLVLIGAYSYFKKSMRNNVSVYFCLFFLFLGDLGFPLLTSYRFVFLIPLFVIVWNFSEIKFLKYRCDVRS